MVPERVHERALGERTVTNPAPEAKLPMANGTFNGLGSPYVHDQGRAAFYREQEEARKLRERCERANHWLALRFVGRDFHTIAELQQAAMDEVLAEYDSIDDSTRDVITKAVTQLWLGKVEWSLFREPRVTAQVTDEHVVSFSPAA